MCRLQTFACVCASNLLLTATRITPSSTRQCKHFLPLPQRHAAAPLVLAAAGRRAVAASSRTATAARFVAARHIIALSAPAITGARIPARTRVAVLDAAHRVVRIDLAQFDFCEDHARDAAKDLVDALTRKCADLESNGDVDGCGPAAGFGGADFAAVRGDGGFKLGAETGCRGSRGGGCR